MSLAEFDVAVSSGDKEGNYNSLNEIHKLQRGRQLEVKCTKDVKTILEKQNCKGILEW